MRSFVSAPVSAGRHNVGLLPGRPSLSAQVRGLALRGWTQGCPKILPSLHPCLRLSGAPQ